MTYPDNEIDRRREIQRLKVAVGAENTIPMDRGGTDIRTNTAYLARDDAIIFLSFFLSTQLSVNGHTHARKG